MITILCFSFILSKNKSYISEFSHHTCLLITATGHEHFEIRGWGQEHEGGSAVVGDCSGSVSTAVQHRQPVPEGFGVGSQALYGAEYW